MVGDAQAAAASQASVAGRTGRTPSASAGGAAIKHRALPGNAKQTGRARQQPRATRTAEGWSRQRSTPEDETHRGSAAMA